jgi:hypothetical protein
MLSFKYEKLYKYDAGTKKFEDKACTQIEENRSEFLSENLQVALNPTTDGEGLFT